MSMATPSTILVTRIVKELDAGSQLTFADRGVHYLKGLDEPWQLYEVSASEHAAAAAAPPTAAPR